MIIKKETIFTHSSNLTEGHIPAFKASHVHIPDSPRTTDGNKDLSYCLFENVVLRYCSLCCESEMGPTSFGAMAVSGQLLRKNNSLDFL